MYNKKGDFGFPVYVIPSLVVFIFTILIFSIIFFVGNFFHNPNLIIKSTSYQDDSKLITILQSKTNSYPNINIAELIGMSYRGETQGIEIKQENIEIGELLNKLPLPKNSKHSNWVFSAEINNNQFITVGDNSFIGTKYFEQSTFIPLGNKTLAKVNLYLDCFACSEEDLNDIS